MNTKHQTLNQPTDERRNHKEIRQYLEETKQNTTQDNSGSSVLGEPIALNDYIKEGGSQIDNLTAHLKKLEKEEQTELKGGRRERIIKIRDNDTGSRKPVRKINNTKSWLFEKINRVDKPSAGMINVFQYK